MSTVLKDVLPHEFMMGEYDDLLAYHYRYIDVIKKFDGRDNPWPGTHKNVMVWYQLANGSAVGWNENLARGWTFPTITYPKKGIKLERAAPESLLQD